MKLSTALLLAIGWLGLIAQAHAQAVSILHSFGDTSVPGDGQVPVGALVEGTDHCFYGTTRTGGSAGKGTVFKIDSSGSVTILHSFGDSSVPNDGANPTAELIQANDGNFYGTTSAGGSAGQGTVFSMTPAGAVTILHSFGDLTVTHDGATPKAGLIQGLDGNFYGTTSQGGAAGKGTVFEIAVTPQPAVTIIHSFGDSTVASDGTYPGVGLVEDAQGNFYGTTYLGGANNLGAIYVINAQRQESILYSFSTAVSLTCTAAMQPLPNGAGGYFPNSRLLLASDGNLYGTTAGSGYGAGTIYIITPQGQESVLHYFGDGTVCNDGQFPTPTPDLPGMGENGLIQVSDGSIYGTTSDGGAAGKGAIFKVMPLRRVIVLHSFGDGTVLNDGAGPVAGMVLGSDGNLYGTTSGGGSSEDGVVFSMNPKVPTITSAVTVNGGVGVAFSYQILATQATVTYSSTALPPGLTLDRATGLISGTPTAQGTTNVTLTVTNGVESSSDNLTIAILPPPVITSILSAFATTTRFFSYQITASENPASFSTSTLPAGLTLNASGLISGTPTVTGTFPVTISATNVAGTGSNTLTLAISSTVPTLSQEYLLLHSFNDGSVPNEGIYPATLVQGQDGTFYGVTSQGGDGSGTIFNLSAAGNARVLAGLGGVSGAAPQGLIQGADGNFYGTTQSGGSANQGTIFKVTPAGVVTVLHTFGDKSVANDGANPQAGLIQGQDGNFYGTTQNGGSANLGTVFEMTPQGTVTILHSFGDNSVANDGAGPVAGLLQLSDGTFYGTTQNGGSANDGTVFKLTSSGTFSTLHSFGDNSVANDGWLPHGALVKTPDGNLLGTTVIGGTFGKGTVFMITTGGTVTILHNFDDGSVTSDGINPMGNLVTSNGARFFGTTQNGGSAGEGTVYEIDYNPSALTTSNHVTLIHSFGDGTVTNDGTNPTDGLCFGADGNLYGTTFSGGAGYGTVYAIAGGLPGTLILGNEINWSLSGTLPPGMTFNSCTGTISGTPLPSDSAGTYSLKIQQTGSVILASPTTYTINLVSQPCQCFGDWKNYYSLGSMASPPSSKDGTPDLLKYLCDIDPAQPMCAADRANLPAMCMETSNGESYLSLTYRQYAQATGLTVNLQTSSDLQNWTTVTPDIDEQVGTDSTTGDPIMKLGVDVTGSTIKFIRLNVTSP